MHPFESSAQQIVPHEAFVQNGNFTQSEAFFLSLPTACVWAASVLGRGCCLGLGLEENRSSKSTSDAPAEPKNEAVFLYISSSCAVRFPAIKYRSSSTLKGVFFRGQVREEERAKRKRRLID